MGISSGILLLRLLCRDPNDIQSPYQKHDTEMHPEPRRHSLNIENPNKNENARNEDRSKQVSDERRCVVGKVSANPPKEKGEARKNQAQKKEPSSDFMCRHNVLWISITSVTIIVTHSP
jgi:hypothetical protein